MLDLHNVSYVFHDGSVRKTAFKDVTFSVKAGEFVTLLGPSGCGKSTLLRTLANLLPGHTGHIAWRELPKIGFVFQHFALLPYLTVYDNVAFGLRMNNVSEDVIKQKVSELLQEVELSSVAHLHPKELSGGMRQRVGIARALAIDPNVLLLDEPFSSLDEFTAENLRKLLLGIWQKRQITVVMVTHLIREALELSDRIVVFTPAPGQVEKVMVNHLKRPRNLRQEAFFKLEDELQLAVKA